jgi:hypothetical protein
MPLTAISGSGTVVVGTTSTFIPDNIHPFCLSFLNRLDVAGYEPTVPVINALNALTWGLVVNGIWDEWDFIHPIVGGLSATHALDMKNAYNTTFFGTWTHASTGMTPAFASNPTPNYADFGYNPSTAGLLNDASLMVYTRTDSGAATVLFGAGDGTNLHQINASRTAFSGNGTLNATAAGAAFALGITNTQGAWLANRQASNIMQLWIRDRLNRTITVASTTRPNRNLYYGTRNGATGRDFASTQQISFGAGGKGLTDEQARIALILVNAFQTALGRNV